MNTQDNTTACCTKDDKLNKCCKRSLHRAQRHFIMQLTITTHIFLLLFAVEVIANFFGVFTISEFFLPLGSITVVFVSLTGVFLFLAQLIRVMKKRAYMSGCGCGDSASCSTDAGKDTSNTKA